MQSSVTELVRLGEKSGIAPAESLSQSTRYGASSAIPVYN